MSLLFQITRRTTTFTLLTLLALALAPVASAEAESWQHRLGNAISQAESGYEGDLGVYVRDLKSGEDYSWRGDESWYLASTIKIPVAITLLSHVDEGRLAMDDTVRLHGADYVDGAGETNWKSPGTRVSLEYLFNQMIRRSDNTATDSLLRLVGLARVNEQLHELAPGEWGPITTLADVRRLVYGEINSIAGDFTAEEFFQLKKASDLSERYRIITELAGGPEAELNQPDIDSAYVAYYQQGYNSGTLAGMADVLESLVGGQALSPASTDYLLTAMETIHTGQNRIKAGLPEGVRFAHKTGTQHRRACNLGIAWRGEDRAQSVIIVACTRGTTDLAASERALRAVGQAVAEAGLLDGR